MSYKWSQHVRDRDSKCLRMGRPPTRDIQSVDPWISLNTLKPVRLIKSFGQNLNWKNTLFEDAYRDWRYYFKVRANKVHPSFGLSVSLSVWLLIFCGHLVVVCAYNLVIYPFIHQVMSQIQWTSFCYSFFQFWLWRSSCLIFNANFFRRFFMFHQKCLNIC